MFHFLGLNKRPTTRGTSSRSGFETNVSISTIAMSALCLTVFWSSAIGGNAYAQTARSEYWQGNEKCDTLFATPLSTLPGGSYLTAIKGEDDVQGHYALPRGGKLRITVRDVGKVPVEGTNFAAAFADLIKRRPLQDAISRRVERGAVLADVKYLMGMRIGYMQTTDKTAYKINPERLTLTLTAKVRVADWKGYGLASETSKKKWDRHQCISYHHEFGHILIAAQLLEESEDELLQLRAPSKDALRLKRKELFTALGKRIRERQAAYHKALADMGAAKSQSRPYLELPFPWLNPPAKVSPQPQPQPNPQPQPQPQLQ